MADKPKAPFGDVIESVQGRRDGMRRAELRVADFVLDNARRVITMNLGAFAREVGVSEPTAIRFCRSVGCDGFSDLKLQLAKSVGVGGAAGAQAPIRAEDDAAMLADKVFGGAQHFIRRAREALDLDAVQAAVAFLAEARRIEIVAAGAAAAIAADARRLLVRRGVACGFDPEPQMQRMGIATLTRGDAVLLLDLGGDGGHAALAAGEARVVGAAVVAIAQPAAGIEADAMLRLPPAREAALYDPDFLRIAAQLTLDMLAGMLAIGAGPRRAERMARVRAITDGARETNR